MEPKGVTIITEPPLDEATSATSVEAVFAGSSLRGVQSSRGPVFTGSQSSRGQTAVFTGRVDLGGCPPKSPTDPGLHITRTRFLIS